MQKVIIYHDVNVGNVWLNAGGVARVSDFGLAVAVDMSRPRQAEMMVSTF